MLNPAQPYFYLLAYVVVLYLRPQEYVPAVMGTPLVPALLLTAFGFWLVAQAKNFEAPQHKLLPALTAAIFISVARSDGVSSAMSSTADFVPTVLLFYIAATSIDSVARLRWLVLVLGAVHCAIALHGIEQAASSNGIGWTGASMVDGRITYLGFFNDPNDLAMAFLMGLPLVIWLASTHRLGIVRWAAWGVVGMVIWAIFLCNSRGSIVGILAMATMYAVRRFGWWRSMLVLPLVLGPLVLLAPSRINEMSADEESAAGRVDAWYEGFDMLRAHPLFGVGKGLFIDHNPLTAHNSFVLAIAELGIVGYYVWLSILMVSVVMLWRLLKLSPNDPLAGSGAHLDDATRARTEPPLSWTPVDGYVDPGVETPRAGVPAEGSWSELQQVAVALAYSLLGTLVAAFFLSRSYVNILYLLIAMIVAVFQIARVGWPALAPVSFRALAGRMLVLALASIAFLWLLTRALLTFQ